MQLLKFLCAALLVAVAGSAVGRVKTRRLHARQQPAGLDPPYS